MIIEVESSEKRFYVTFFLLNYNFHALTHTDKNAQNLLIFLKGNNIEFGGVAGI